MRKFLAVALAAIGMAWLPAAAEAEHYRHGGKYYRVARACDHTCVRARNLDPTGVYAAYPYWARAALSPKGGRRF
jgi:hypothetical protein